MSELLGDLITDSHPDGSYDLRKSEIQLLLKRYRDTGDKSFREQLVELLMPLVKFFAYKFSRGSQDFEDLVQVGSIGLLKAIDRYNPSISSDFMAFLIPNVVGEMKRYLRDSSWLIKVPRHLKELRGKLSKVIPVLQVKLGRAPTVDELAEVLKVSREEILEAMELSSPTSLNSSSSDDELPLESRIGIEEREFEKLENIAELEEIFKVLEPIERYVLYLKFFYGLSQTEIAKRLNVSQMTVSRIQNRALKKLRELKGNSLRNVFSSRYEVRAS